MIASENPKHSWPGLKKNPTNKIFYIILILLSYYIQLIIA